MWQKGQRKEVIDYCLRDIKITKEIYFKFINNQLIDPVYGDRIIFNKEIYNNFERKYKRHQEWVTHPYRDLMTVNYYYDNLCPPDEDWSDLPF
jgi:hypothetical protein